MPRSPFILNGFILKSPILKIGTLALCGTLFLFWLMLTLINTRTTDTPPLAQSISIDFIRTIREESTQTKQRKPPRPRAAEEEPPPPPPPANLKPPPHPVPINAANLGAFDYSGLFSGAPVDGDALALVRVLPHYPARALQRGIEGWVLLEFSINTLGQPLAPRVIESEPKGIFEAAAITAVKRWKYRPSNTKNPPLIRQRIRFQLADDRGRSR